MKTISELAAEEIEKRHKDLKVTVIKEGTNFVVSCWVSHSSKRGTFESIIKSFSFSQHGYLYYLTYRKLIALNAHLKGITE